MHRTCCWKPGDIQWDGLKGHYETCKYISGEDWAFWVCAYTGRIFYDREAYKQWTRYFAPTDRTVQFGLRHEHVTVLQWVHELKQHAMKRQLMAMFWEVEANYPNFAWQWMMVNGGSMVPNLEHVEDLSETLRECSQLMRKKGSCTDVVIASTIYKLAELFNIDINNISYLAMNLVQPGNNVIVADADPAQFTHQQEQALAPQSQQVLHFRAGGVQVTPVETFHQAPEQTPVPRFVSNGDWEVLPTTTRQICDICQSTISNMNVSDLMDLVDLDDSRPLDPMIGILSDVRHHPPGPTVTYNVINADAYSEWDGYHAMTQ